MHRYKSHRRWKHDFRITYTYLNRRVARNIRTDGEMNRMYRKERINTSQEQRETHATVTASTSSKLWKRRDSDRQAQVSCFETNYSTAAGLSRGLYSLVRIFYAVVDEDVADRRRIIDDLNLRCLENIEQFAVATPHKRTQLSKIRARNWLLTFVMRLSLQSNHSRLVASREKVE